MWSDRSCALPEVVIQFLHTTSLLTGGEGAVERCALIRTRPLYSLEERVLCGGVH